MLEHVNLNYFTFPTMHYYAIAPTLAYTENSVELLVIFFFSQILLSIKQNYQLPVLFRSPYTVQLQWEIFE